MIQSMTGFGRGEVSNDSYKVTIEIKSVNHRYCDIVVRLPRKLNSYETIIRNQTKTFAYRGKIDVYVSLEDIKAQANGIKYNKDIAETYLAGIRQISKDFLLEDTANAYTISRFPDVFTIETPEMDEEVLEALITEALNMAGKQFMTSRGIEGEKLHKDILDKLNTISHLVDEIEQRSPKVLQEYREKLTNKVTELLGENRLDESVLATELVIYADKICVDEEMVRLRTHISHMKETLANEDNIGRKLDFLTQELNREANTTLSKANDIEITNYGIQLKTEIEKIREQIQNIE